MSDIPYWKIAEMKDHQRWVNSSHERKYKHLEAENKRSKSALQRIKSGPLVVSFQSNPKYNPRLIATEALKIPKVKTIKIGPITKKMVKEYFGQSKKLKKED